MLDSDTRRRIDTCRNILVGKLPDPKGQVEQITLALIYKFMSDMDLKAGKPGKEGGFFTGDLGRYRWPNLVGSEVSSQEVLGMYSEALGKIARSEHLPELFRSVFRNASLPYSDPESLRAFLEAIDGFQYDGDEPLGDAFEYLLSVLGSQGDAGQFRTPRHIIDFMVDLIDPKKDEVILDPACGTGGFLISAYRYILRQNPPNASNGTDLAKGRSIFGHVPESPSTQDGCLLTSDERKRLFQNIKGYDIAPDMVRLSLVNLYLHGFASPNIEEYDTLTRDDKWGEMADVILANPPFMSPKGGVKRHARFQVESKRSEALFIDYIVQHLKPNGRSAIVVPEGFLFQDQSAYRDLRKTLIEGYLATVISLPAGVFNPYSGVKTSILILDRKLAEASKEVAFFKIENDGFSLDAKRKAAKGSELEEARENLLAWLQAGRSGKRKDLSTNLGNIVERGNLFASNDYNLQAERYKPEPKKLSVFPMVPIGEVCKLYQPKTITQSEFVPDGPYKVYGANGIIGRYSDYNHKDDEVLVTCRGAACGKVNRSDPKSWITGNAMVVKPKSGKITKDFLFELLKSSDLPKTVTGSAQPQITQKSLEPFLIPLPPIDVQRKITSRIRDYEASIENSRKEIGRLEGEIASAIAEVWKEKA